MGFYGLDLYSMFGSIQAVIQYLEGVDPEAARRARQRYGCFHRAGGEDPQAYGYAAELGITDACVDEAVHQLQELREQAARLAGEDGGVAEDEHFYAEQNARLVKNAEEYYRSMFAARVSSWNLRDCHMADTLDALLRHFEGKGIAPKVVVWEHNSHLGDASATQMGEEGEWNVGQLVRERHGDDARLIGFSTYTGTVTAASAWDGPAERKRVRPGMEGSFELLLHEVGIPDFYLPLRDGGPAAEALREARLERAIGVIYKPETERWSHYFHARLGGPVRRRDPLRPHARPAPPGAHAPVGKRRAPGDVPERGVMGRVPAGANEFAAGNSRSPPARTGPCRNPAEVHRCVVRC